MSQKTKTFHSAPFLFFFCLREIIEILTCDLELSHIPNIDMVMMSYINYRLALTSIWICKEKGLVMILCLMILVRIKQKLPDTTIINVSLTFLNSRISQSTLHCLSLYTRTKKVSEFLDIF